MLTPPAPDLFVNVHKGLRKALFDLVLALGRAEASPPASAAERALARQVVGFLRVHGENEDVLIVPLLQDRAPDVVRRIARAHDEVAAELAAFERLIDRAPSPDLFHAACHFTAFYLEHMRLEEVELERPIRDALSEEEAAAIGPRSMARTPEALRIEALGFMLAAMPTAEAEGLLGKLPAPVAAALRPAVA
jgi:hypothetical protein